MRWWRRRRRRGPNQKEKKGSSFFNKTNDTSQSQPVQTKSDPSFFQKKEEGLTVGQPDDQYEQQADDMAQRVVNRQAVEEPPKEEEPGNLNRYMTNEEFDERGTNAERMEYDKDSDEGLAIRRQPEEDPEMVNRQATPDKEKEPLSPKLQKQDKEEEPKGIHKASEPDEQEEQMMAKLQKEDMPDEELQQQAESVPEEEEMTGTPPAAQTKSEAKGGQKAGKALSAKVESKKGKGKPLPKRTKTEMEKGFGRDLSDVRIHTDRSAAEMNEELQAQAFTHEKDIHFNAGKFDPDTQKGKELLAHELTHVLQQKGDEIQKKPAETQKPTETKQPALDSGAEVPAPLNLQAGDIWISRTDGQCRIIVEIRNAVNEQGHPVVEFLTGRADQQTGTLIPGTVGKVWQTASTTLFNPVQCMGDSAHQASGRFFRNPNA